MEFILICSGLWNLIFSFSKWSIEAKDRLLKVLCAINGVYLTIIGICGFFFSIERRVSLTAFLMLLFTVGTLVDHKYRTEKNTVSKCATVSAIALTVIAAAIMLFAQDNEDIVYSCAILTGGVMILSTPFTALFERIHEKK